MSLDVSNGLHCLHSKGFVHADFAARNCLVTSKGSIVIGDYGVSKDIHKNDYYEIGGATIPIRWVAPEDVFVSEKNSDTVVAQYQASYPGNVWSLAIIFWEIFELGSLPYHTLAEEDVIENVIISQKSVVDRPQRQPSGDVLYQLMLQCCASEPQIRPSVEQIIAVLSGLYALTMRSDIDFDTRWEQLQRQSSAFSDGASVDDSLFGMPDFEDSLKVNYSKSKEASDDDLAYTEKVNEALRTLDQALSTEEDGMRPNFDLGLAVLSNPFGMGAMETQQLDSLTPSYMEVEGRAERGEFEDLVREKSRSVTDLMRLTHVENGNESLSYSDKEPLLDKDNPRSEFASNISPVKFIVNTSETLMDNSSFFITPKENGFRDKRLTSTPHSSDGDRSSHTGSKKELFSSINLTVPGQEPEIPDLLEISPDRRSQALDLIVDAPVFDIDSPRALNLSQVDLIPAYPTGQRVYSNQGKTGGNNCDLISEQLASKHSQVSSSCDIMNDTLNDRSFGVPIGEFDEQDDSESTNRVVEINYGLPIPGACSLSPIKEESYSLVSEGSFRRTSKEGEGANITYLREGGLRGGNPHSKSETEKGHTVTLKEHVPSRSFHIIPEVGPDGIGNATVVPTEAKAQNFSDITEPKKSSIVTEGLSVAAVLAEPVLQRNIPVSDILLDSGSETGTIVHANNKEDPKQEPEKAQNETGKMEMDIRQLNSNVTLSDIILSETLQGSSSPKEEVSTSGKAAPGVEELVPEKAVMPAVEKLETAPKPEAIPEIRPSSQEKPERIATLSKSENRPEIPISPEKLKSEPKSEASPSIRPSSPESEAVRPSSPESEDEFSERKDWTSDISSSSEDECDTAGDGSISTGAVFIWKDFAEREIEDTIAESDEVETPKGGTPESFVPSTWNSTLTPTKSALKSPEHSLNLSDQKKSVSFRKTNRQKIYSYPPTDGEHASLQIVGISPNESPRRQWSQTQTKEEQLRKLAQLADWEYDEDGNERTSPDYEFNVVAGEMPLKYARGRQQELAGLYQLSSLDYTDAGDDDNDFFATEIASSQTAVGSTFNPRDFFPDWARNNSTSYQNGGLQRTFEIELPNQTDDVDECDTGAPEMPPCNNVEVILKDANGNPAPVLVEKEPKRDLEEKGGGKLSHAVDEYGDSSEVHSDVDSKDVGSRRHALASLRLDLSYSSEHVIDSDDSADITGFLS